MVLWIFWLIDYPLMTVIMLYGLYTIIRSLTAVVLIISFPFCGFT